LTIVVASENAAETQHWKLQVSGCSYWCASKGGNPCARHAAEFRLSITHPLSAASLDQALLARADTSNFSKCTKCIERSDSFVLCRRNVRSISARLCVFKVGLEICPVMPVTSGQGQATMTRRPEVVGGCPCLANVRIVMSMLGGQSGRIGEETYEEKTAQVQVRSEK